MLQYEIKKARANSVKCMVQKPSRKKESSAFTQTHFYQGYGRFFSVLTVLHCTWSSCPTGIDISAMRYSKYMGHLGVSGAVLIVLL